MSYSWHHRRELDNRQTGSEPVFLAAQWPRSLASGSHFAVGHENDKDPVVALREIAARTAAPEAGGRAVAIAPPAPAITRTDRTDDPVRMYLRDMGSVAPPLVIVDLCAAT